MLTFDFSVVQHFGQISASALRCLAFLAKFQVQRCLFFPIYFPNFTEQHIVCFGQFSSIFPKSVVQFFPDLTPRESLKSNASPKNASRGGTEALGAPEASSQICNNGRKHLFISIRSQSSRSRYYQLHVVLFVLIFKIGDAPLIFKFNSYLIRLTFSLLDFQAGNRVKY